MPVVMTFYRFARLAHLTALRGQLAQSAEARNLTGTVLLAEEGINGTLSGARPALRDFADELCRHRAFAGMTFRFSSAAAGTAVFYRLKVRIRPEIVQLGQPAVIPERRTGERVDPDRWNALLDDPAVVVLDARNDYEVAIGTFPGARNPGTRSFRALPGYVLEHLDPHRHPQVAMFCTGGIRCEKASAWLLAQGFDTVYQLDGGILGYLETVAEDRSRWQGECFVFDQRVSVNATLEEGRFEQCFACRRPLSPNDVASPRYRVGVSCPHCFDEHNEDRRARFSERRRQVELAERRGRRHVGAVGER